VGLKPTYGLVSRFGLVAYASSLDQIGPLSRTVEDSALLLQAIAGYDVRDSTSIKVDIPDYTKSLKTDLKGRRIGVIKETFDAEGIDATVKASVEKAIQQLKDLGAEIQEFPARSSPTVCLPTTSLPPLKPPQTWPGMTGSSTGLATTTTV